MKTKKKLIDVIAMLNNSSCFNEDAYYYDIIDNRIIIINCFLCASNIPELMKITKGFTWFLSYSSTGLNLLIIKDVKNFNL